MTQTQNNKITISQNRQKATQPYFQVREESKNIMQINKNNTIHNETNYARNATQCNECSAKKYKACKIPQGKARQGKAGQGKRRHRRNESPRNTTKPALDSSKAWSVETRPAPSRHSRDGRVYGHTTTAMHETSTPPFPSRQKTSSAANLQAAAQQRLETLQPVPVLYGEDL